jgi:hypothetical protein
MLLAGACLIQIIQTLLRRIQGKGGGFLFLALFCIKTVSIVKKLWFFRFIIVNFDAVNGRLRTSFPMSNIS